MSGMWSCSSLLSHYSPSKNRHASCSRLLNPYWMWKLAYWGRWYSQLLRREKKKLNLFSYELAYWKRATSETDSPYFAFRVVPLVKTYTKYLRRPNWSTPVIFRNIIWQNMRGKDMAEMGILKTTPEVAVSASTTRIRFQMHELRWWNLSSRHSGTSIKALWHIPNFAKTPSSTSPIFFHECPNANRSVAVSQDNFASVRAKRYTPRRTRIPSLGVRLHAPQRQRHYFRRDKAGCSGFSAQQSNSAIISSMLHSYHHDWRQRFWPIVRVLRMGHPRFPMLEWSITNSVLTPLC